MLLLLMVFLLVLLLLLLLHAGDLHNDGARLIVTDPGRAGRSHLLASLRSRVGDASDCRFFPQPLPSWAPNTNDLFDGSEQASDVGLLLLPTLNASPQRQRDTISAEIAPSTGMP